MVYKKFIYIHTISLVIKKFKVNRHIFAILSSISAETLFTIYTIFIVHLNVDMKDNRCESINFHSDIIINV